MSPLWLRSDDFLAAVILLFIWSSDALRSTFFHAANLNRAVLLSLHAAISLLVSYFHVIYHCYSVF